MSGIYQSQPAIEPHVYDHDIIDVETWKRKPNFDFYKDKPSPLWGVTVRLDVTKARRVCQEHAWKYLQASLFLMALAVNETEAMQLRMRDEIAKDGATKTTVIRHHRVHPSCPIMREDETYGFCVFESNANNSFTSFREYAQKALEDFHSASSGMNKSPRDDILHGSVLPWIDFTSYEHATGSRPDIPKYVFGKIVHNAANDTWSQSFCIHTHHSLADGLHVGRFLDRFQKNLDKAEQLLMT